MLTPLIPGLATANVMDKIFSVLDSDLRSVLKFPIDIDDDLAESVSDQIERVTSEIAKCVTVACEGGEPGCDTTGVGRVSAAGAR